MKAIKTAFIAAAVTFVVIYTGGTLFGAGKVASLFGGGTVLASTAAFQYAVVTAIGTLVSAGIGMLTSRGISATKGNFGTKLTGRAAQAPRQIVYGKCRVAGTIVKMTTSGTENNKLHMAIVLAGHEIQSLEAVYLNDILLTTSSATTSGETVFTVTNSDFTNTDNDNSFASGRLIRFTFHNGSQTAVDGLAAASLSSDYPATAKFQGMAYVYMELIYDPEKNGQLPALWFEVKGKKVFDPRDDSTAWSANPALIIRDYLTDTTYGLKAVASEINDGSGSTVGSFHKAADICDESTSVPNANLTTHTVTVAGGKFVIDGTSQASLTLTEGNTYKFDQSNNTNSNHPLRFSATSNGTHGGGSQYTTGFTSSGTAGSSGAYVQITVATSAPALYYYCANHSGMGGSAATPSGSSETRYTANGFTNASASGEGILEGFLTSCAGAISYTNGQFNLFVGGDQSTSLTITDEDVLGDISISTKAGNGEMYNTVKSIFVDASAKYEAMEAPVYENATYLAADTPSGESSANYKRLLELQFPFTTTQTMAQRLSAIVLDRQRQTATISLLTTIEYLKLQPSDWVNVTNTRMSYSSKTFEVQSTELQFAEQDGNVFAATRLTLQEIDTTIYDYSAGNYVDVVAEGSNVSGGSLAISAPTNLTLTQITSQEGTTAKIAIKISWTNNGNDAIQGTEISYRLSTDGGTDYKTAGIAGKGETSVTYEGGVVGKQYYVRIRHFAFDNVYSAYTSPSNITIAEPDTISAPTSVSASTGRAGFIEIGFTAPAVESVIKVNIYYSTSSGFTPASGNLLTSVGVTKSSVRKHAVGISSGLAYGTTYYFKLKAENSYGTESSASSEVSGSFTQTAAADIADATLTAAKFASSIEPVTIVSSVPASKITESIYNTGDNELYQWNGSAYETLGGASNFSQLSGTASTAQIANLAITTGKLADEAGTAAKIATNAITATKISDGAVETAKLASNAVTAAKITAGTITASELAANSVTATQISAGAVTAGKIDALAVTAAKINAGAITADKVASNAITAAKIASSAITAGKISAGAIGASAIAANVITVDKLASSSGSIATGLLFGLGGGASINSVPAAVVGESSSSTKAGGIFTSRASPVGLAAANTGSSAAYYAIVAYGGMTYSGGNYSSATGVGALGVGTAGGYFNYNSSKDVYLANANYSVDATGNIYTSGSYLPFTGAHESVLDNSETIELGDIVVDVSVVDKKGLSDVVTKVEASSSANQKTVLGVYAEDAPSAYVSPTLADESTINDESSGVSRREYALKSKHESLMEDHKIVYINAVGEGLINVTGESGNISAGDLIVTSSTSGKGMKQSDDIIRSYTVAKAREDISFDSASDTGQIACIYLCG